MSWFYSCSPSTTCHYLTPHDHMSSGMQDASILWRYKCSSGGIRTSLIAGFIGGWVGVSLSSVSIQGLVTWEVQNSKSPRPMLSSSHMIGTRILKRKWQIYLILIDLTWHLKRYELRGTSCTSWSSRCGISSLVAGCRYSCRVYCIPPSFLEISLLILQEGNQAFENGQSASYNLHHFRWQCPLPSISWVFRSKGLYQHDIRFHLPGLNWYCNVSGVVLLGNLSKNTILSCVCFCHRMT